MNIGNRIFIWQSLHQAQLGIRSNLLIVNLSYHQSSRHIHRQLFKILCIYNGKTINRIYAQLAIQHFHKTHAWQDFQLNFILQPCHQFPEKHHSLFCHHWTAWHCINYIHARQSFVHNILGNLLIKMGKILSFLVKAIIGGKGNPPLLQHRHCRMLGSTQIKILSLLHQFPAFQGNIAKISRPQADNLNCIHDFSP